MTDFNQKEFERLQRESVEAINQLREVSEKGLEDVAEYKSKVEKLEKTIDAFEAKNQELVTKIQAEKAVEDELKTKIEDLERKLFRMPSNGSTGGYKESPEYKAWEKVMRYGTKDSANPVTAEEFKYLRTDNDAAGGYLVNPPQLSELVKTITEISPVRQVARIKQTTTRSLPVAVRSTLLTSTVTGEGASTTDSQSAYDLYDVNAYKITAETAVSLEELQDAAFDMQQLINQDIIEEFARKEGALFVNGTGANEPTGFMVDSNISTINSEIADDIKFDNFLDLTDIKEGYNLMYMMNRATKIRVQKLKNGDGDYLWTPSTEAGAPATINGLPYAIAQDMPSIGAGNKPVICGDFGRGYTIVDRVGMAMVRDELTQASNGLVRFIAHKRVGGLTHLPEAFKTLTCAV